MSDKQNNQSKGEKKEIEVNKDPEKRKKSNGGYDHPPQGDEGYKKD